MEGRLDNDTNIMDIGYLLKITYNEWAQRDLTAKTVSV